MTNVVRVEPNLPVSGEVGREILKLADDAALVAYMEAAGVGGGGSNAIISSGAISDITGGQEADIEEGTTVTTTDGRRWLYVSGTKTSEASYIELADVTPAWSVIAGKPSTFPPDSHTHTEYAVNLPGVAWVDINDFDANPEVNNPAKKFANVADAVGAGALHLYLGLGTHTWSPLVLTGDYYFRGVSHFDTTLQITLSGESGTNGGDGADAEIGSGLDGAPGEDGGAGSSIDLNLHFISDSSLGFDIALSGGTGGSGGNGGAGDGGGNQGASGNAGANGAVDGTITFEGCHVNDIAVTYPGTITFLADFCHINTAHSSLVTGHFTDINATNSEITNDLALGGKLTAGGPVILSTSTTGAAAGAIYRTADTLRYRDSTNSERTILDTTVASTSYLALAGGTMTGPIIGSSNVLQVRSGTTAQTLQVYGTYTDASNYVRASVTSNGTSSITVAAETAGGADDIDVNITPAGTGKVIIAQPGGVAGTDQVEIYDDGTYSYVVSKNGQLRMGGAGGTTILRLDNNFIYAGGTFIPSATNVRDFGASGTDWRDCFVRRILFETNHSSAEIRFGSDVGIRKHDTNTIEINNLTAGTRRDFACRYVYCLTLVEANTAGSGAPNVLTAGESRSMMTNEGTTVENYHTLPTAVAGYEFEFSCADTDGIRIVANTGDDIRIEGTASASAGYIKSTVIGSAIKIKAINATNWVCVSKTGTWTIDS